jgi:hypothetical protein
MLLIRFHLGSRKSVGETILSSFKQGLITFFVLLFSLGLFEYLQGTIFGKPVRIIDTIDFAIAFLGFALMFAAKLLEGITGKR